MVDVIAHVERPVIPAGDTPARVQMRPGGSAANVAAWLGFLGIPTTFVGCIGDDTFGREARVALEAHGVVTHLAVAPTLATGTCVVIVGADGERTMLPDHGANSAFGIQDLPRSAFPQGGHLHLTGYSFFAPTVRPVALAALQRARTRGMTLSVDASSAVPLAEFGGAAFLALIGSIDTLFATVDEADALCGSRIPSEIARLLEPVANSVALKFGSKGAFLLCNGKVDAKGSAQRSPAAVLDTTGAGDGFAAGWIAARLTGATARASLDRACQAGSDAVTLLGARPSSDPRSPR